MAKVVADFKWKVQPYRFLTELKEEYTRTVLIATRASGERLAKEGEQWMKQNAPWRDRSEDERAREIETGWLSPSTPHAREGLFVKLVDDKEGRNAYQSALASAKNQDALQIDKINEQRKEERNRRKRKATENRDSVIEDGVVSYESARKAFRKAQKRIRTMPSLRPISKLPKSRSAAAAVQRKERGFLTPLVEIRFSHGRDIPYAVWLEIAHGGRWGIISKAIGHFKPKLMAEIKKISTLVQYRDSLQMPVEGSSPEERFARHVANENRYRAQSGEPEYKPWSAEEQASKRKNQARYRVEKKARKKAREANEKYKANMGTPLNKYTPPKVDYFPAQSQPARRK